MSVYVIRTFVRMRNELLANTTSKSVTDREVAEKLNRRGVWDAPHCISYQ